MPQLLDAVATDTTGESFPWSVGRGQFTTQGTWDGATVTFQRSRDGGTTWLPVGDDTTMTANGIANFEISSDSDIRAVISSAGTTSLTAWADRL